MRLAQNNKGFTLPELIVVIAVITIIALVSMRMLATPSKIVSADRLLETMRSVLLQYALEHGGYPSNEKFQNLLKDSEFILKYFPLSEPINPFTNSTDGIEISGNSIVLKNKKGATVKSEELYSVPFSIGSNADGIGEISPIIPYNLTPGGGTT